MRATSKARPWAVLVAAVVGMALVASACGSGSDSSGGGGGANGTTVGTSPRENLTAPDPAEVKDGGKIVYGLNAESDGFSPSQGRWASSTYIVGFSIMDPLAAYDADQQVQPYLAKEFVSADSFKQWTIKLREGVLLHNGNPVDSALVKKNLDAQKASPLTGETMAFVESITTPDPLTVVVKMNKPWATFPHTLTAQVGAIAAEETFSTPDGTRSPSGSGPFIFQNWVTGKNLNVKKNPNYWRKGFPHLDNIEFQPLPDVNSRGQSLASNTINIFETTDASQITQYIEKARNKEDGVQVFTDQKGDGSKIFIGLNTTKPPFDNMNARLALAYAGDTEALSQDAYEGVFPPAFGVFSENSPFYAKAPNYPTHDINKAKEYAAKYEAETGQKLTFTANITPDPGVQKVAQVLQAQAAEAGIEVTLNSEEQIKLILDALTGNYQATGFILFGSPHLDREYVFIAATPKPNGSTSLNFTRNGLDKDGKPNGANDAIVNAMNKARETDDFSKQKEQYAIVQEEMAKNLNFLFLVRQTSAVVYEKNLHGALVYTLPNESGAPGKVGNPTTNTFTFNLWLSK